MDILTVSVIVAVSAVLLIFFCIIFIRLFGRGIFWGLDITGAVVLGREDDVRSVLWEIVDGPAKEFEYSHLKIVIVDTGMDMGQLEVCRSFCERYNYFLLSAPDELGNKIVNIQKRKNHSK